MGRFNEILGGAARFSRAAARIMGVAEQEGVTTVSPELVAMLALEVDRPDWAILKDERLCAGFATQPATALTNSGIQFRNPAGSGVIATVTSIQVATNDGSLIIRGDTGSAALGTLGIRWRRDRRGTAAAVPTACSCEISRANDVNGGSQLGLMFVTASFSPFLLGVTPWVIPDLAEITANGDGFQITTANINTEIRAIILWSERPQLPSERVSL